MITAEREMQWLLVTCVNGRMCPTLHMVRDLLRSKLLSKMMRWKMMMILVILTVASPVVIVLLLLLLIQQGVCNMHQEKEEHKEGSRKLEEGKLKRHEEGRRREETSILV